MKRGITLFYVKEVSQLIYFGFNIRLVHRFDATNYCENFRIYVLQFERMKAAMFTYTAVIMKE
jgi:hypothetical protein